MILREAEHTKAQKHALLVRRRTTPPTMLVVGGGGEAGTPLQELSQARAKERIFWRRRKNILFPLHL